MAYITLSKLKCIKLSKRKKTTLDLRNEIESMKNKQNAKYTHFEILLRGAIKKKSVTTTIINLSSVKIHRIGESKLDVHN